MAGDGLVAVALAEPYRSGERPNLGEGANGSHLAGHLLFAFALVQGLRHGWLEGGAWELAAERGWRAALLRIADDGRLVDVCTGTGKQRSLRDYYDRAAILGVDGRGGAMALLLATNVAGWRSGTAGGGR